jgi:hypothetical protein
MFRGLLGAVSQKVFDYLGKRFDQPSCSQYISYLLTDIVYSVDVLPRCFGGIAARLNSIQRNSVREVVAGSLPFSTLVSDCMHREQIPNYLPSSRVS